MVAKLKLKERWIQAMCKVPMSLIGFDGYTEADAKLVCEALCSNPPRRLTLQRVGALEKDVERRISNRDLDENSLAVVLHEVEKNQSAKPIPKTKIKKAARPKFNPDDYPTPWCKVMKDGVLIRYEDANGKPIPEELWPQ